MSTRRVTIERPEGTIVYQCGHIGKPTPVFDIELVRGHRYIVWPDTRLKYPKLRGKFCTLDHTRQRGGVKAFVLMEESGERVGVDAHALLTEAQHAQWLAHGEEQEREKAEVAALRAPKGSCN